MDNVETSNVPVEKKTYRPGSIMGDIQTILLNTTGDFNVKDLLNWYTDHAVKNGESVNQNTIRMCRIVVYQMQKDGTLTKVSRGRWKKA